MPSEITRAKGTSYCSPRSRSSARHAGHRFDVESASAAFSSITTQGSHEFLDHTGCRTSRHRNKISKSPGIQADFVIRHRHASGLLRPKNPALPQPGKLLRNRRYVVVYCCYLWAPPTSRAAFLRVPAAFLTNDARRQCIHDCRENLHDSLCQLAV